MTNIPLQRQLADCFYLAIPLCDDETQMRHLLDDCAQVERSVARMLKGDISPEELLEAVEGFVPSIDKYIEEVEENLEQLQTRLIL